MLKNLLNFCKNIIKQNKILIYIILILFTVGIIHGFYMPLETKSDLISEITKNITNKIPDNAFSLMLMIFLNNFKIASLLIIMGFIIIPSLLIFYFNGIILGIFGHIAYLLIDAKVMSFGETVLAIIPHGILEIPLIIFSLLLGLTIIPKIFFTKKYLTNYSRKTYFKNLCLTYIIILMPLFFIAAAIETYITPMVVSTYQKYSYNHFKHFSKYILDKDELKIINKEFKNYNYDLSFDEEIKLSKTSLNKNNFDLIKNLEKIDILKELNSLPQYEISYITNDLNSYISITIIQSPDLLTKNNYINKYFSLYNNHLQIIDKDKNIYKHTKNNSSQKYLKINPLDRNDLYIIIIKSENLNIADFKIITDLQTEKFNKLYTK